MFGGLTPVLGATDFRILWPAFAFTSLSYTSLTIDGASAVYRGTGRVNGASGYSFTMSLIGPQCFHADLTGRRVQFSDGHLRPTLGRSVVGVSGHAYLG